MSAAIATVRPEPGRARALLEGSIADFGEVSFEVRGDCMGPDLEEGDVVRILSTRRRRPRFGDVVLVATGQEVRLHRLVFCPRLPGARWRTKGDRAPGFDGPIAPESALGMVLGVEGPRGLRPVFSPRRALGSLLRGVVTRVRRLGRFR